MNEKIALITSFYNHYDRYLENWIGAVLQLTEMPDEIIIGISGKDYDPKNILKAQTLLTGKANYKITMETKHYSMGRARNDAVRQATADWIMYLNVDDLIVPDAITRLKANMTGDVDIIIGGMQILNHPRLSPIIRKNNLTKQDILKGSTNDHATYRRSLWQKSKYIEYSGDVDVAFWIGLIQAGARLKCIPDLITKHIYSETSVSAKYSKQDYAEIKRMIKIWNEEGVHSKRFNSPQYQPKSDYGFKHTTK